MDEKYVAIIEGTRFDEDRVQKAFDLIFDVDPELADAIRMAIRWEEIEDE